MLVLYVSATRRGPVGGLFVVLLYGASLLCSRGPERVRRDARVDTGAKASLETPLQSKRSVEMGLVSYRR